MDRKRKNPGPPNRAEADRAKLARSEKPTREGTVGPSITPTTVREGRPWTVWMAAILIVAAVFLAYRNSLRVPFLLDDRASIQRNPTVQSLWPIWETFLPPNDIGQTVAGRPMLNFSLAVSYAWSEWWTGNGLDVWAYHLMNVAIHALSSLLLFGIVRRTLLLPTMIDRWGQSAAWLAFAIALVWAVHPLQTESVTYIVQRAESLVGFFYLLTLYCVIRGGSSEVASSADTGTANGSRRIGDAAGDSTPPWPARGCFWPCWSSRLEIAAARPGWARDRVAGRISARRWGRSSNTCGSAFGRIR
jgi:hypothetical protein